ncbi:5-methylcytosine-specific restriction endonuclease McrA [Clostridium moniliforme]|uniref:5-methylcytosine-specific restriction endonuclease McrA n=1 Tax=Clostridium moniliforme TaxID=39489 RepID=A0ABS4F0M1_9CLOT|nr:5-methylcytosine-specific restriction endonuclease McrA [Clostridium moniliforme]
MHNEEQKKFQKFYSSKQWKCIRELAINDTLGIDIINYYKFNRITAGKIVHHIVELNEDYSKRLNRDNLIYLTESNHKFVHKEYCKGNKANMQELLLSLKLKFMEEFNL